MSCHKLSVPTLALLACPLLAQSATAALVNPTVLNPGATISPLQNGGSGTDFTIVSGFPVIYSFDFRAQGGPTGTLFENIVQYPNTVAGLHPYGSGLMFDFRFSLTSGDVTKFGAVGYAGYDASVKQCDFVGCLHVTSGAVGAASASRTADGNEIDFSFSHLSASGAPGTSNHTGNFQIFTNATSWVDPPGRFYDVNGMFTIDMAGPVSAVPEPSTWMMMILGFCGLGYVSHRRRNSLIFGV
ncbi:PEP-CTERM sorting domain-containing protein [Bradyrhizobium sp.]|uniref:PEP-CTERM sorting domain-containing protein n=1 Tax=Bradyrhizobium sp. TaxID=376 RepID=UPI002390D898|nr:PEP-CTERM sorting domain-containing protein [Bradyrhizobium sp.]MDE2378876.1 PEP-CTERM sorting domain-containing protein [Bradyrhizobium sp.]